MQILLATTHTIQRRVVAQLLSQQGHDVAACADVVELLSLIRELTADVIVLDYDFSSPDAEQILSILRANGCTAPMLALISGDTPTQRETCLTAGFADCLAKPVDAERLQQALSRFMPIEPVHVDVSRFMTHSVAYPALARELLSVFAVECPRLLATLKTQVRLGNTAGISRQAHKFVGLVGNFDQGSAYRAAMRLE